MIIRNLRHQEKVQGFLHVYKYLNITHHFRAALSTYIERLFLTLFPPNISVFPNSLSTWINEIIKYAPSLGRLLIRLNSLIYPY